MTYDEWEPIAAELLAAYPLLGIPAETVVKYANDLSDLPAHCVFIGARAAVKRSTFFPTIAEIREHAEAERSKVHATLDVQRTQLASENDPVPLEERRRLIEKWGPRIREILARSEGPLVQDLSAVAE